MPAAGLGNGRTREIARADAGRAPPHGAARALRRMESAADRVFGAAANPLRQLGALAALTLWIALASGAWLYVWFDASPAGAWRSVAAMAEHPLHRLVRGVHRYAADAFILLMLLHALVEWAKGRHRGFRWFTWITGVPLLPLAVATGVVGYWLVADMRAQFVATALGEWLGALPGVGVAMARDFATRAALGDRLFALLMFIHVGVALIILLALWTHFLRLVRPRVLPAATAGWALAGVLLALALFRPAVPGLPADFAVVDATQCSGCGRCFDDCPYGAVTMVARSDGSPHAQIAQVRADLCAACGICVGACPSSTPFRTQQPLVSGIDLPQRPLQALRAGLAAGIARVRAAGLSPVVRVQCVECAHAGSSHADDEIVIGVACSAALPPSFVEYAQRLGARTVTLADCGAHGCAYRFGGRFTRARLRGERDPYLRPQARGPQVRIVPDEEQRCRKAGEGARPLQRAMAALRR